ncbi:hypothetical protein CYMTET_25687 [Cymbomonas tetramitiformis]|uniref:Cyclic nucleotide-binding domain-containing protein n=1 Tax=Cymbomonas tetramitiformis TaxID=36881 RepID=A0AAE0FTL1_9CHLO|nr:hypothetical protein CYMTET_25687 [Cymbomonas tetramitiformis]
MVQGTSNSPQEQIDLLRHMSPYLRGEVTREVHGHWFRKLPVLKVMSSSMQIQVAMTLKTEYFTADEEIFSCNSINNELYLLDKGMVGCQMRVLLGGSTFGEDMLAGTGQRGYAACTLVNSVCLSLSRKNLEDALQRFPDVRLQLRKHVVKCIAREGVLKYCQAIRATSHNSLFNGASMAHLTPSLLKLVYDEKLEALKKADPARHTKMRAAADVIRRHYRGWLQHNVRPQLALAAANSAPGVPLSLNYSPKVWRTISHHPGSRHCICGGDGAPGGDSSEWPPHRKANVLGN